MRVVRYPDSEKSDIRSGESVVSSRVSSSVARVESIDGMRCLVRWLDDGKTYNARRSTLQRFYEGVVVTAKTNDFRRLSNQVLGSDRVLELGCSAGESTVRLLKRSDNVIAVDKAEVMLAEARQKAPRAEIHQMDCVADGDAVLKLARRADVVFLDLGGRMAMANAVTVLQSLPPTVRLTVVKSLELDAYTATINSEEVDLDDFCRGARDYFSEHCRKRAMRLHPPDA